MKLLATSAVLAVLVGHAVAISSHCQTVLNSWCNDDTVPRVAGCLSQIKADGAKVPLYARFDTDEQHGADAWRCYSPSSLTPDLQHYSSGKYYCTEAALVDILLDCENPAPTNSSVLFPYATGGVYAYRIPLLLSVADSTLLTFAEARITSLNDRGPKHLSMRRSTDGGQTWGDIVNIVSDPSSDPTYDGLNLGAATFDAVTKTVFVHYLTNGHSGGIAKSFVIQSKDLGLTWSKPTNLTDVFVAAGIHEFAPGPGTGVQLSNGTMVLSGWYIDASRGLGSMAVVSTDHGATWKPAGRLPASSGKQPNECQIALLEDDVLIINMRNGDGSRTCPCRLLSYSHDGGATWTAPQYQADLPDPICQGSVIANAAGSQLYFSNADNPSHRENGTVHTSVDGGKSWQVLSVIDPGAFAYSALALTKTSPSSSSSSLDASQVLAVAWEHDSLAFTIRFNHMKP